MASLNSHCLWGLSLLSCFAIPAFAWITETGKKFILSQLDFPWNFLLPTFILVMAGVGHYYLVSFIEWAFVPNPNTNPDPKVTPAPPPSVWTKFIIEIIVGIWVMVNSIILAPSLRIVYLLMSYLRNFASDCQVGRLWPLTFIWFSCPNVWPLLLL